MRYIIHGAGAIGAQLGAFLAESGSATVLIARGQHLTKIRADGVRLVTPQGNRDVHLPVVASPAELVFQPDDVLVLMMKSQDVERALQDLREADLDTVNTPVFCGQSAIVCEAMASRYFARIYGITVRIPGVFLEPGVIYNYGLANQGHMDIGRYPTGIDPLTEQFVDATRAAGYSAFAHADVMGSKRKHFFFVATLALAAITDGRGNLDAYSARVHEEVRACFAVAGLSVEADETYMARYRPNRGLPTLKGIEGNRGSTWQSLKRRQGTIETDFLNGEVVVLGRAYGIPTPFNAVLQEVAHQMARNGDVPGRYSADDLFELAMQRA